MSGKYVNPSAKLKSFSCAHCGALADHTWFESCAFMTSGGEPPRIWTLDDVEKLQDRISKTRDHEEKETLTRFLPYMERWSHRLPYLHKSSSDCSSNEIANVFISSCYSCKDISIWLYDSLIFPVVNIEIEPNSDLDHDIRLDFNEAKSIFSASPRAAAALLRLCVQKLCRQLGMRGKKIDDDIGALVQKGLPVTIQQALDLVRVIGNNAVHPGEINLNDDRDTAYKLFELVNLIAYNQISQPKAIAQLFDQKVPDGAKQAISRRDTPKLAKS